MAADPARPWLVGPRGVENLVRGRKVKVAKKTTISIGATAEQTSGPPPVPDATLVVGAFTVLGERCPKH